MTVAPIKNDDNDDSGVAAARVAEPRRGLAAQLLAYYLAWRHREAERTIARYTYLIGQPADFYRVHEAELARPTPPREIERAEVLQPTAVLKDCV